MTSGQPGPDLERLPGVLAATLFLDDPATPRVYLAVAPEADGESLRQAVVGLLADRGYDARPDRIHIGTAPGRVGAGAGIGHVLPRVHLDGLDVRRGENRVHCDVRLRSEPRSTTGSATEPDTPSGRARAAARATLTAAEALDPDFRFGLQGIRTLDLFGHEGLVVLIDAGAGRAHTPLPGSALLDRSIEEAAALATLHALRSWSF